MPPGKPQDVWKNNRPTSAAAPGRGSRSAGGGRRWFGAAVVLAAAAGAAVGLFIYLRADPDPVLLAFPVTQYGHPDWPPNPWAEDDARGLRDRFGGEGTQAFQFQEKARILRQLNQAADESRDHPRRPLVVYLSALGATTPDGVVHVVPGDGRPDEPAGWVPLADLLQPLRRTPAPRLLVLDVRPAAGPRSLLPAVDVNESLDAELERLDKAGDLPFLVLTANTPADGAGVLRPFRRTVFGLALAHGAGGAADGWDERRSKDGQVSAQELAAYVREATFRASTAGGFAPQLPRLHGRGTDFKVLAIPHAGAATLPSPADPPPYPDWLTAGWKDRDAWAGAGLHYLAPRLVRHLSAAAGRAERRWLASLDPKAVQDQFEPTAADLRVAAKGLTPIVQPVRSAARIRGRQPDAERAAETALRPVLDKIREPAGVKPDDLAAARQAVWAKPPTPPEVTAAVLFAFATSLEDPTHEQMRQLSATAEGFRLPPSAELLTVHLIAGIDPSHARRWPPGTVRRLLLVTRDAEDAAATDGRCLPWVQADLADSDDARRRAVRTLFNPKTPDDRHVDAVKELDAAATGYAVVRRAADGLKGAWQEYEETRAVLADLATAYPDNLLSDAEAVVRVWGGLVEDFRGLQAALRPASEARLPEPDKLSRLVSGLRANRASLRGMLKLPDEPKPRQWEAALAWPWWTHTERLDLVGRYQRASRSATDRALGAWPLSPGQEPTAPPRVSAAVARDSLRDLRRLTALVTLADVPDADADAKVVAALAPTPEADPLSDAFRRVRTAWRVKLPDAYKAADAARRAEIGWAVDPDDVPAGRDVAGVPANPERPDRAAREKAFHRWLAESRLRPDAQAVRDLNLKAKEARTYADGLDAIAADYLGWNP